MKAKGIKVGSGVPDKKYEIEQFMSKSILLTAIRGLQ